MIDVRKREADGVILIDGVPVGDLVREHGIQPAQMDYLNADPGLDCFGQPQPPCGCGLGFLIVSRLGGVGRGVDAIRAIDHGTVNYGSREVCLVVLGELDDPAPAIAFERGWCEFLGNLPRTLESTLYAILGREARRQAIAAWNETYGKTHGSMKSWPEDVIPIPVVLQGAS